jgi:hypothetical protein
MNKLFIDSLFYTVLVSSLITVSHAVAVQFPDGRVAFEKSPLLLDAYTTFNGVRVRQAKYYFDIKLPSDVGESLKKVAIEQREGADTINFKLDKTKAFFGTHSDRQEELPLQVSQNETTKAIVVTFDRPIPPGSQLTIRLQPKQNPDFGGTYLFGVTAFPTGEKPTGLYLGVGRLQFHQSDDRFY